MSTNTGETALRPFTFVFDVNGPPTDLAPTATTGGGLSLNQDGGNDAYLIADDGGAILGGLTALTAEVRFSMTAFLNSTNFFSYATASDDNVFKFNIRDDGDLSVSINSSKINSAAMDYRTLADGVPHTLSVTWNSSGGAWEMFVDGASKDSGSGLKSGVTLAGGGALVMGNDQDSVDGDYDPAAEAAATLYDARIFNDIRTPTEVAANFGRTLASTESGMIANWTFNDRSTDGVITDTISGNHLTVKNVGAGGDFVTSTPELTLSVRENTPDGTAVGTATGIDPDAGDTLTYSLVNDAGGRFDIDPGTGVITVKDAASINFADATAHGITLRVTDSLSHTFDKAFTISVLPTTITVDTTDDYGTGDGRYGDTSSIEALLADKGTDNKVSLREAMAAANKSENGAAPDEIHFEITDALVGGVHAINVLSGGLPTITDQVLIDGSTESDYVIGTPVIMLNGSSVAGDGLQLLAGSDGSTIRGLTISRFGDAGIKIYDSDNNTIVGNWIGTGADGTTDQGNTNFGIELDISASNQIGGATLADRNVIAGNNNAGITIWNAGSTLNVIQGNYIGVDKTGGTGLGNAEDGIVIGGGANNNTIGGDRAAGEGNVISGQIGTTSDGIEIDGAGADDNKIYGNYIGTNYDGTAAIANARYGVVIYNGVQGTKIGGTGTGQGNIISGNTDYGVIIDGNGGSTTSGNDIQGNTIGLNAAGTAPIANAGGGVYVLGGAQGNTIGGTSNSARNVVSGNTGAGIYINGVGTDGNDIQGNYIGTDISGAIDRGNTGSGIYVNGAATTTIDGNLISGNDSYGIQIYGATTTATAITGNQIGLHVGGTTGLLNTDDAIYLNATGAVTVGGVGAGDGNVINATSGKTGIDLYNADDVRIEGNLIGTNAAGTAKLSGGSFAINVWGSANTQIGGPTAAAANVVAGYVVTGINISDAGSAGTQVQGNFIGTDANDTVDLTTGFYGVTLQNSATGILIGGTPDGAGNTIARHSANGIRLMNTAGNDNSILRNTIHSNGNVGIELGTDGVTANDTGDADTGPNDLQNYPQITKAVLVGSDLTLSGTLDTDLASQQYRIEFFGSALGTQDADNGEGRYFLGATTLGTNGTGDSSFSNVSLSGVSLSIGDFVTATATKIDTPAQVGSNDLLAYGQTSEFAANFTIATGAPTDIVFDSESTAEQQVNSYVTNDQIDPAVAAFDDGGYIIVWVSDGQGGSNFGIYGQRHNADGSANGNEFLVTSEATDAETNPTVATFSDGGFVVAWQDQTSGAMAWTEARVFHANGTPVTSDFQVSPGIDGDNEGYQPAVVTLNANEFVVVWANEVGGSTYEVAGQVYNRTGATVGAQFSVGSLLSGTGLFGAQTEVTRLNDGGFAVTWRTHDGSNLGTRMRVMNADGTGRSPQIGLNGDNIADIATLANGNIVVTYDSGGNLKAAIYTSSGVLDTAEFTVNTTASATRYESTVTASDDGFVVVWESSSGDGAGTAILAQRFDESGNKVDSEILVNQTTAGNQLKPEVIETASGRVIAVWQTENLDGSGTAVAACSPATGTASVNEGAANGTRVGDVLGVTDVDIGDSHTYSLVDNAGGRFSINGSTGVITVADGTLLDYEASTNHAVTVRVTDGGGLTFDEVLTISLKDVDEAPFNSIPGAQTTDEETTLTFSAGNGNQISIGDDSGETPNVVVSVNNGTLTVSGAGGATVSGDGTASVNLSGSVADINLALDGLQYDPAVNFAGGDTLTSTTTDGAVYALNIDADLQGYYAFSIADPAGDSSPGGANDGALNSGAAVVNDATRGDVLSLDGSGDHVAVNRLVTSGQQVTFSGWVNVTAGASTAEVIDLSFNLSLRLDAADGVQGSYWDGSFVRETNSGVMLAGTGWHHIAYTVDSATDTQTIYVDGAAAATTNYADPIVYAGGDGNTYIGSSQGGSPFFEGLVDDARIYGRALSAGEIADLASAPAQPSAVDTVAITVNPVNDAPVRTAGTLANLVVGEDSGLTSLGLGSAAYGPGGGADESGQTLTYQVTTIPTPTIGDIFLADGTTRVTTGAYTLTQIQGMQFKPADNESGGTVFQFNVLDSGGAANGGSNNLGQSMTITVNAVNDAPSFGSNQTLTAVNEDTASPTGETINSLFSGTFSDTADSHGFAGVAIGNNAANAVTEGTWQYTTNGGTNWYDVGSPGAASSLLIEDNGANTKLRFVPVGDFNGTPGALTVYAVDDSSATTWTSGVITQTFDTTSDDTTSRVSVAGVSLGTSVNAANDEPSFTTGGDQTVAYESGAHTVAGFATPAPGGGADESGQTFSYTVSNDNGALFSVAPTIDANGQLTYTVANGQSGTATVTVSVTDSGGTANGGDNTSPDQTFDITVSANTAPTISDITDQVIYEDGATNALAFTVGDAETAVGSLLVTATSSNTTLIPNGNLVLTDGGSGNWTLVATPAANLNGGPVTITVTVDDGTTTTNETFDVTVNAVNDAPSGSDGVIALTSDKTHTLAASDFGFADSLDGNDLAAVTIAAVPLNGVLTLSGITIGDGQTIAVADIAAGLLRYTPATIASGATTTGLTFQVHDNGGTAFGGIDTDPSPNMLQFVVTYVDTTPGDDPKHTPPAPPPISTVPATDAPTDSEPPPAIDKDVTEAPPTEPPVDETAVAIPTNTATSNSIDADADAEAEAALAELAPTAQLLALDTEHNPLVGDTR